MAKVSFKVDLEDNEDVAQVVHLLTLHLKTRMGLLRNEQTAPPPATEQVAPPPATEQVAPPPPVDEQTAPPPPVDEQTAPPPPVDEQTAPPPPVEADPDVELDSAGMPWDPAKHSEGRSKLKDGTWRTRRNTGGSTPKPAATSKPAPPPPGPGSEMAPEELTYKVMIDKLKGAGLDFPAMNALAAQVGKSSIALLVASPDLMTQVLTLAGLE